MSKAFIFITTLLLSCSNIARQPNAKTESLLHFYSDDNYLALFILVNTNPNRRTDKNYTQDILNFQNKIWAKNKSDYERLLNNFKGPNQLTYLNFKDKFEHDYVNLISSSIDTDEFKVLKKQNDAYKKSLEKMWNDAFSKTETIVVSLTGLNLDKASDVMITHPGLRNGRELQGQLIEWGGYSDQAYVVTYLWHELLHQYFNRSNLSHSVIELITDNELHKQITGVGYPPFRGHQQLRIIENCLADDWESYIARDSKNIMDFLQTNKAKECGALFEDLNW